MKKKIAAALLGAMMVCGNAFAMTFEQPVKIGSVGGTPIGGFSIQGASYNDGTRYKYEKGKKDWGILYEKGIARFGNGENALYLHYDCSSSKKREYWEAYSPKFGDKSGAMTVSLGAGEGYGCTINTIENDSEITMYLLCDEGSVAGTTNYVLLGRRDDGTWVKYFDMEDINMNYFGRQKNKYGTTMSMRGPQYKHCYCKDDTIIIEYQLNIPKQGYYNAGEFRFKWDEAAQWFGVEQVVY